MGYDLDGSTQSFQISSILGESSGSMWFYPTDDTRDQALYLQQGTTGAVWFGIYYLGASTDKVRFSHTGGDTVSSSGTVNLNDWNHVYWSYDTSVSPDELRISLNGEALQTQGRIAAFGAMTVVNIGRRRTGLTSADQFAGSIAELALYSGDGGTAEVLDGLGEHYKALSLGFSALCVSPNQLNNANVGLMYYWPMRKDAVSKLSNPLALTPRGGPSLGIHPRIFNKSTARLVA